MIRPLTDMRFRTACIALFCVAVLFAYANTFDAEFVWDDASSVLLHKHVQDPRHILRLFREDQHAFSSQRGKFYRPLLSVSFMVDFALSSWGRPEAIPARGPANVSPFLFHVSNTAWHAAAVVLLFLLFMRLQAPRFVCIVVPLLYAVHPLHTEAIAYISGRADPMAAAFMFAGLTLALTPESKTRPPFVNASFSAACFAGALLSKESAAIYPALLLALLIVVPRPSMPAESAPTLLTRLLPLLLAMVVLVVYVTLRITVLKLESDALPSDATLWKRLVESGQAFAVYLRLIFFPTGLHMERTLDGISQWWAVIGAILLATCLAFIVLEYRQGEHRAAAGMAWFVITWFPISGIFPLNAPMAEHWMYVPLAGFLWALAEVVWPRIKHNRARCLAAPITFALFLVSLILTVIQNQTWHDNETLYLATLRHSPNSYKVQYNLGVTYEDLLGNGPGARRHYLRAIELFKGRKGQRTGEGGLEPVWDEELRAHLSLGNLFLAERNYPEAAPHYAQILRIEASTPEYRALVGVAAFRLGKCMLAMGHPEQARAAFHEAREATPEIEGKINLLLPIGPPRNDDLATAP